MRPHRSGGGAGARLLAPVALAICAIAVFSVLSAGGSDEDGSKQATDAPKSAKQDESTSGGVGGDGSATSTSDSATEPVRATYRVKAGDTFSAIAEKTGIDVDKLAELNPEVDPRALQTGQKLKLK